MKLTCMANLEYVDTYLVRLLAQAIVTLIVPHGAPTNAVTAVFARYRVLTTTGATNSVRHFMWSQMCFE